MSDTKNTGGPAFPTRFKMPDGTGGQYTITENGMTLRDHFAGLAMQGLICSDSFLKEFKEWREPGEDIDSAIAHCAYDMADFMLKAREQ
jgi:hypothetical protein